MSADPLDHRKETGPGGVQGLHNRHGFPQEVITQVLGNLNGVLSGHFRFNPVCLAVFPAGGATPRFERSRRFAMRGRMYCIAT
jgi:hypothetical protein